MTSLVRVRRVLLAAIERVGAVVGSADAALAGVRDVATDAQRALAGVVEGLAAD